MLTIDTRKTGLTGPEVTIELDSETCFILAEAFKDLGEALTRAKTRYDARRRFEADKPALKASKALQRASIAARAVELKGLPPRKVTSAIAREFEITWDEAGWILAEIRREERAEALLSRGKEIDGMLEAGKTLKEIADALGLKAGYVRNIVSRRRKKLAGKGLPRVTASGRFGAV